MASNLVRLQQGYQDAEKLGQDFLRIKEEVSCKEGIFKENSTFDAPHRSLPLSKNFLQLLMLDKRRQQNREALRALRNQDRPRDPTTSTPSSSVCWLLTPGGDPLVRTAIPSAISALETDQAAIEIEFDTLYAKRKQVLSALHDIGMTPESISDGMIGALVSLRDKPASKTSKG